jgi:hypothetical protein
MVDGACAATREIGQSSALETPVLLADDPEPAAVDAAAACACASPLPLPDFAACSVITALAFGLAITGGARCSASSALHLLATERVMWAVGNAFVRLFLPTSTCSAGLRNLPPQRRVRGMPVQTAADGPLPLLDSELHGMAGCHCHKRAPPPPPHTHTHTRHACCSA